MPERLAARVDARRCWTFVVRPGEHPKQPVRRAPQREQQQAEAATPLVHVHAAVFAAWFAVLLAQTLLVASGRRDLHRRLGIAGAALVPAVFGIGLATSLAAARTVLALSGPIYDFCAQRRVSGLEISAGVLILTGRPVARFIASSDVLQAAMQRWL